jgi:hypothetical protein
MYNVQDIPLRHRLPMTRIKLIIARVLYRILRLMRVSESGEAAFITRWT